MSKVGKILTKAEARLSTSKTLSLSMHDASTSYNVFIASLFGYVAQYFPPDAAVSRRLREHVQRIAKVPFRSFPCDALVFLKELK